MQALQEVLRQPRRTRLTAQFFRSLATLLGSGVHLVRALDVLQQQLADPEFSSALSRALRQVEQGQPLSRALAGGPFNRLHLALIAVGERSGALQVILNRLGDQTERSQANSLKVFSSLSYPCVVFGLTVVGILLGQNYVLKGLLEMLRGLGADLPWPTRLLSQVSSVVGHPLGLVLLLLLAATCLGVVVRFREALRTRLYKLPVLGPVLRLSLTLEILNTLSLCLRAGMPVLQILDLLASLDPITREPLKQVQLRLKDGEEMSQAWAPVEFFPPLVGQVLKAGEESGNTVGLLEQASHLLELQLDQCLASASAALQPLVMLILGLLVGFVLIATLMPLLQITSNL